MRRLLPILLILLPLVVGCKPPVRSGIVYQKDAWPERHWIWLMPMTMSTGKSTTTYVIPMPMYDPPAWSIDVQEWYGERARYARWYISEHEWDGTAVGDSVWREKPTHDRVHQEDSERD